MELAVPAQTVFQTGDKVSHQTADGFRNVAARLGVGPDGTEDNLISGGTYNFNLVTRNRILLEAAYRGSWVVGRVIDTRANDMVKAGIQITTNDGAEEVTKIKTQMSRLQIWQALGNVIRWADLYGGAIGVLQIKGQALNTPLDPDTISKGQFEGIAVYDRWQLNPSLAEIIPSGPDIGLPKYYDIVLGSNLNDPGQAPGDAKPQSTGIVRVHHTRCIRMEGIHLPFFQAITENMWGESVLERMWDRLINFDSVTASVASLVFRASLRTVGIDGLREIVGAGGAALEGLMAQFDLMKRMQNNEGITLLDKLDDSQSTAYSFAGLSDVQLQAAQQVSGASETPLVSLFGQSPAGLNATGESDLRLYAGAINSRQESKMRNPVEVLLKVLWLSVTGKPIPKDLTFTFAPIWEASATDKATIAKNNTDTIMEVFEAGVVDRSTTLKELKQSSAQTGLFSNITDEQIEEAEGEEPPEPQSQNAGNEEQEPDPDEGKPQKEIPGEATGELTAGPTTPRKSKDSAWKRIRKWVDAWNESDHPRADNGEFGSGGGGGSSSESGEGESEKPGESEADKLRAEAEKEDDRNNPHGAEALREKARKLEKKPTKKKAKNLSEMTVGELKKKKEVLSKKSSNLTDRLIIAGHGNVKPSEMRERAKEEPLFAEYLAINKEIQNIHGEAESRGGPGIRLEQLDPKIHKPKKSDA